MKKLTIALASAATLAIAACSGPAEETDTMAPDSTAMNDGMTDGTMTNEGNIVQVAQNNPEFSTLVSAVTSAGLGETLSGTGPYTVFAPTNAAFDKVPQATRDELMSPAGKQQLTNILTLHVVEGDISAEALTTEIQAAGDSGYSFATVNGEMLTAKMDGGNVVLTDPAGNTATVTMTDIDASNGVIHAINTVLMPS